MYRKNYDKKTIYTDKEKEKRVQVTLVSERVKKEKYNNKTRTK